LGHGKGSSILHPIMKRSF